MVYTQALVFGNGMAGRSEQENLVDSLRFLRDFESDKEKLIHCGSLMKAQSSSSKCILSSMYTVEPPGQVVTQESAENEDFIVENFTFGLSFKCRHFKVFVFSP